MQFRTLDYNKQNTARSTLTCRTRPDKIIFRSRQMQTCPTTYRRDDTPNPSHIRKLLGKWLVSRSLGAPTKLTFVADKCSLARQRPTRRHPTPTPIFWKLLGKWLFSQFRAIFIFFVLSLFFGGRGAGAPGPRLVRLWILCLFVAELWVITFPVGYHWKCVCDHCIYAESRDLWARGQKELHAGTAHLERSARPHPHRGWSCLVPKTAEITLF